ncbi:MAG: CoA transferase [Chromatiales bacterium]|jgi:crotonobetainyl-CoA:carnitine CoA-transferase CaiB-like acyl-CoA transferase|nr:CoA transferase [Chromatiales bacterium]
MQAPLEGIRVLDLSHALAGPHCSTMLADYGAEVFKLETPLTGDIARAWGVPLPGGENSYFVALHRNKRGLSVDLKSEQGKKIFLDLVDNVDVVLENFRVGSLERLGLGYEVAKARNPGIIYCSVSGFGQDGPYRDRAAMDLVVQGESGMISITGEPDSSGARCGVSIADLTAGMYAAFGIVMAIRVKEKTGQGQLVDVSMLEGQMSLLNLMLSSYMASGEVPRPMGTAYGALLPYQAFSTQSDDLTIAIGSQKLWNIFCPLIGQPEWVDDPRFASNTDRVTHREELTTLLQGVFLTNTYDHWAALFEPAGIPFGALNTVDKLIDHPQVVARGALVDIEHPRAGPYKVVGVPVRLSETPGGINSPSPSLGEHTSQTLRDLLGMGDDEIAQLLESGVVFGQ